MPPSRWKLLAAILAILCVLPSCDSYFDDSVTVYPTKKTLTGEQGTLWRMSYKASFETQTVVYWYPGWREYPEKMINTTVRDRHNWVAEYVDHSGKVVMVDGKIVCCRPDVTYVSPYYWWYLHLNEKYLWDSR